MVSQNFQVAIHCIHTKTPSSELYEHLGCQKNNEFIGDIEAVNPGDR